MKVRLSVDESSVRKKLVEEGKGGKMRGVGGEGGVGGGGLV